MSINRDIKKLDKSHG